MRPHPSPLHRSALAAACLLVLGAGDAYAKDESKIMLRMEPLVHADDVGRVQSFMWDGRARLDLQVRRLEPATEHVLRLDDGTELAHFTTSGAGHANLRVDLLQSGSPSSPPVDPRGHELFVSDPSGDVLSAWLYGPKDDDPDWCHVKEWTDLDRSDLATTGSVLARYELNPSGKPRFVLQPRHIPAGDYDVYVGGVLVASFVPNAAGNAHLDFRAHTKGFGAMAKGPGGKPGHNHKLSLDFDPRSQLVELRQGADVLFFGPMLAQIPGLNVCRPRVKSVDMTPADPASAAEGTVDLGREDDCERTVVVTVAGLPAGSYELVVDGVVEGTIAVAADGAPAAIAFANTPDAPGELPLDFPLARGSLVEVRQGAVVVLGVILP